MILLLKDQRNGMGEVLLLIYINFILPHLAKIKVEHSIIQFLKRCIISENNSLNISQSFKQSERDHLDLTNKHLSFGSLERI